MGTSRFFCVISILLLITVLFLPSGSAQDYTRWRLPEGAIARFEKGDIDDFAYLPDGNRIAVRSAIGLWIYDVHTGEELDLFTDLGTKLSWNLMVLSPDGKRLAAATYGEVVLWDLQANKVDKLLVDKLLLGHNDRIYSLAFSPTGEILAGGSRDTTIRLWDVSTGELKQTFVGHTDMIRLVAYSNDGKTLACTSWKDWTILIWDVETEELLKAITGHTDRVSRITYAPDSRTLASVGWKDPAIRIWDVKTGKLLKTFVGHTDRVSSIIYSRDGATLVSGGADKTIRMWDTGTGETIRILKGHTQYVDSVMYSPMKRRLSVTDTTGRCAFGMFTLGNF